jgi:hypothetical protein
MSTSIGTRPRAVWAAAADDAYAVGDGGAIHHWDGATWTAMASPATDDILAVWGTSADHVLVGTETGAIFRWDGVAWTVQRAAAGFPVHQIAGVAADDVFAATLGSDLLHWDGFGWAPVRVDPATSAITGLWIGPDSPALYVGTVDGAPAVRRLVRDASWANATE